MITLINKCRGSSHLNPRKTGKTAVRRGAAHEVGGGMAWPYLCGRVLPLPIGDWVQGCVSRLQAALRAWPNTLDIKVVAQGEDSTEKASGTARACRGAFTSDKKKTHTKKKEKTPTREAWTGITSRQPRGQQEHP